MQKKIFFLFLYLLPVLGVFCQDHPMGKFLKKKVKVGEPLQYTLSLKYPVDQNILFPDSTYPFTPFEFIDKTYFNTVSDSLYSFDSAVYTLATFGIDSIQHLALPIFLIENGDTTKLFALPDSILLIPTVTTLPDSVKLFENTSYVKVQRQINYSYWLIGVSVLLLFVILFILVFGKTISRKLKIRRLRRQHDKFLTSFQEIYSKVTPEKFENNLLNLYSFWKLYMQKLTNKPFTSYSSKEIHRIIPNESLKESLIKIDRGIYAHRFPNNMSEISKILVEVAKEMYNNKLSEVRHAAKK